MSKFRIITDKNAKVLYLETNALGSDVLTAAKLNKGTAFTESERQELRLRGKLPYSIESLQQQELRVYQQFLKKERGAIKSSVLFKKTACFVLFLFERMNSIYCEFAQN